MVATKPTKKQRECELPGWRELRRKLQVSQQQQRDIDIGPIGGAFGWVTPSGWYALKVPNGILRGQTTLEELDELIGGE